MDATGQVVPGGCHPTKGEADSHVAALYANEPGAAKMMSTDCASCAERAAATEGAAHFRAASVDNSAWDGPAAMSNCTHSGTPASCFAAICAGKKAGDTATQAAWALPHHKTPGSPPNAAGVSNSLSRLPTTQGLTNAAAARTHLENHMHAINPDYEPSTHAGGAAQLRRSAITQNPALRFSNGQARSQAFKAQLRGKPVQRNGREMYHVDGYASVFDVGYLMYDMFGPYEESMDPVSFAKSMARDDLDTAFLVNHRGMTMARTVIKPGDDPTLILGTDSHGLAAEAWLNLARQDVRDFASAVDDELIDEMSFAFMLNAGHWNDDYDKFRITEADIHRGDVSGVNYGANPYTSIAARAGEILAALDHLPAGAARAALMRLQSRADLADTYELAGRAMTGITWQPVPEVTLPVPAQAGSGHGSFSGTHSHPHPAYGSQGSDESHDHPHDHNGDGQHTHSHGKTAGAPQDTRGQERSLTLVLAQFNADNELEAEMAAQRGSLTG